MRSRPAPNAAVSAPSRARVAFAWGAVVAWIALVWWLGSGDFNATTTSRILDPLVRWLLPDLPPADRFALLGAIRKLAHPVVYGVLAGLAFAASRVSRFDPPWRSAAVAFVLALATASFDEARQAQVASRTGALGDVGLDAAGAIATLAVALSWTHLRPRPPLEGG